MGRGLPSSSDTQKGLPPQGLLGVISADTRQVVRSAYRRAGGPAGALESRYLLSTSPTIFLEKAPLSKSNVIPP